MVSQKFTTQNTQETRALAEKLARELIPPMVICLYGDLGAGKTTFVQGLTNGLGIKKRVVSPTFVFIRQYCLSSPLCQEFSFGRTTIKRLTLNEKPEKENFTFYHIDLYRLKNFNDVKALGMEEILTDKDAIIAIEWPEKIKEILPKKRIDIYFKYLGEDKRELELIADGKLYLSN